MCFQVVDDVLDVTRSVAELGKPVGNDVLEGVYTLPVIYALETDARAARPARAQARTTDEIERVVALVAVPDVIDASLAVARTHATKANEALAGAPELDAVGVRTPAHARRRVGTPLVMKLAAVRLRRPRCVRAHDCCGAPRRYLRCVRTV